MKTKALRPEFVESFPELLEEGTLYISDKFSIAGHKCCCGCGEEVITPLNAAQWQVRREGGLVSLHPSIGNWKFACRSHYWIRKNRVVDAPPLPEWVIDRVKKRDRRDKDIHIKKTNRASGIFDWMRRWWRSD